MSAFPHSHHKCLGNPNIRALATVEGMAAPNATPVRTVHLALMLDDAAAHWTSVPGFSSPGVIMEGLKRASAQLRNHFATEAEYVKHYLEFLDYRLRDYRHDRNDTVVYTLEVIRFVMMRLNRPFTTGS